MAVTVSGSVSISANVTDARTTVTGALNETGQRAAAVSAAWGIASGTGAGLADKMWSDTRTVAGSATDVIDLATVLTNAFGAVETFVKMRAIVIVAASTNTTTLQIVRPAATGLLLFGAASGSLAPLSAGGFFGWADPAAGVAVGAGASDLLNVINSSGASASYTVVVVGTSA